MTSGVSVLVCSHNGAGRVGPTLEALSKCDVEFPAEVILIDNNSTDGTAAAGLSAWARIGETRFQFRVVSEPRPGKAYAIRKGVMEANYEYIVICDDDNWLAPDYLRLAVTILSDPKVGATGGQGEPVVDDPIPSFMYSHGHWFALGVQALSSGDVTHTRGALWGAGLAARRSDLLRIYECPAFPILDGRKDDGSSLTGGDDCEICWAITVLGKMLVYDERLKFRHAIARDRLQIEYVRRLANSIDWDDKIRRLAAGMQSLRENGRARVLFLSALRSLRHYRSPDERSYHTSMLLAACGFKSIMTELSRKLYTAVQDLQRIDEG